MARPIAVISNQQMEPLDELSGLVSRSFWLVHSQFPVFERLVFRMESYLYICVCHFFFGVLCVIMTILYYDGTVQRVIRHILKFFENLTF